MLIEFAEVRPSPADSSRSAKQALARAWQSSKLPSTAKAWTLSPRLANCFSWSGETRPCG